MSIMVQMRVTGLTQKPDGHEATLMLQDVTGDLGLAFVIPMNEANRLARVLILELAGHGGLSVSRTVLDGDDQGICAAVVVERDGAPIELSCHPADALALALRTDSPIYAAAGAMGHACRLGDAHTHEPPAPAAPEDTDVARWLQDVRPEDFGSAATP